MKDGIIFLQVSTDTRDFIFLSESKTHVTIMDTFAPSSKSDMSNVVLFLAALRVSCFQQADGGCGRCISRIAMPYYCDLLPVADQNSLAN